MSNDNLILFPKKRTPSISMSDSEAKWMIAGSLMVILTLAVGINSALFSPASNNRQIANSDTSLAASTSRAPASVNPIFRISWEKKAFEVLAKTKARDLANVGKKPSVFDKFAFGTLEGHYSVRKVDGLIAEIQFSNGETSEPKALLKRQNFLSQNLGLFSSQATKVEPLHVETNEERVIERFAMKDSQGHNLGIVQMLLDKDQNLLSMTVQ